MSIVSFIKLIKLIVYITQKTAFLGVFLRSGV